MVVATRFRAIVFVDDVDDAHDRPNGDSQDDDDGERDDAGHVDSSLASRDPMAGAAR